MYFKELPSWKNVGNQFNYSSLLSQIRFCWSTVYFRSPIHLSTASHSWHCGRHSHPENFLWIFEWAVSGTVHLLGRRNSPQGGSRKGEQTAPSDHLLASPGRHNSQVQLVTFSPVPPLWLPTTDSKKQQIFPPVIFFFSVLCEEHFLLWHFSIYISPNCFIKVLFVCFPQMCTPLNISI